MSIIEYREINGPEIGPIQPDTDCPCEYCTEPLTIRICYSENTSEVLCLNCDTTYWT